MKSFEQEIRQDLALEEELLHTAVQIYCASKQGYQTSSEKEELMKRSIEEARLFLLVFKVAIEY